MPPVQASRASISSAAASPRAAATSSTIDGEADFAIQLSKAIGMKEADFTL
jgi:hypothetical protein